MSLQQQSFESPQRRQADVLSVGAGPGGSALTLEPAVSVDELPGDASSSVSSARSPTLDEVLALMKQLSPAEQEELRRQLRKNGTARHEADGGRYGDEDRAHIVASPGPCSQAEPPAVAAKGMPSRFVADDRGAGDEVRAHMASSGLRSQVGTPAVAAEGIPPPRPTTPEATPGRAAAYSPRSEEELEQAWLKIDARRDASLDCARVEDVLELLGACAERSDLEEVATGLDADGNRIIDYEDFVSWYLEGARVGKVRKKMPLSILKRLTSPYVQQSSPGVTRWLEAEATHREMLTASNSTTALIERLRRDRERRTASSAPGRR